MENLTIAALKYHSEGKAGKLEVVPTKPSKTQNDLSLAYSPGVAAPCAEIRNNPDNAYKYTCKGNLVAVISNGSAVLGLGNIGAIAGKPVMEGKCFLFKVFADIDAFDIEINEHDPSKIVDIIKSISPTFGGINLEDIKAPECFYIEERLKAELDIPIMHDDQHGTAIITGAGLLNALEVVNKDLSSVNIVINGAGSAGIAITKFIMSLGAKNIILCDKKGIISQDDIELNINQKEICAITNHRKIKGTLSDAMRNSDVFIGVSSGNILSKEMILSMNKDAIIFAMANPIPEILPEEALSIRKDIIMATGRSDYPNQVNNVLGFPYIFRGALDVRATTINEEMKIAACKALANLAKQPVPQSVLEAYQIKELTFGKNYIIPTPFDPRLKKYVAAAVAKAAIKSGVAMKKIIDIDNYYK